MIFNRKGQFIVSVVDSTTPHASLTVIQIPEDLLNAAQCYFFRKAVCEVNHFMDPHRFEKKSILKDGILYFMCHVLPMQEIGKAGLADAMFDLSASTFCVPVTDSKSTIGYAIVSEIHWYDPNVNHGGMESILRCSQQTAYIIGGRDLVKTI